MTLKISAMQYILLEWNQFTPANNLRKWSLRTMSLPDLATSTNLFKPIIPDVHQWEQSQKIIWYDLSAKKKNPKKHHKQKKRTVDLNVIQQMAINVETNILYTLCQGWKGKEAINIFICGKSVLLSCQI